jgi:hypothetical protein
MIFLYIILVFFALHFISCLLVNKLIKCDKILFNKYNIQFGTITCKSLKLTIYKGRDDVSQKCNLNEYLIIYGGFYLSYSYYLKNPKMDKHYNKYITYGGLSYKGEWFWDTWCFHNKTWDNPFKIGYFKGCYVFDIHKCELINKKKFEKFNAMPFIRVLRNVNYHNAKDELQEVKEINWWIEQRTWTTPFLHLLHLDNLYTYTRVDLEFDTKDGLGVNRDTWKGGVHGASINLEEHPETLKLYKETLSTNDVFKKILLRQNLNTIIENFMEFDKKY